MPQPKRNPKANPDQGPPNANPPNMTEAEQETRKDLPTTAIELVNYEDLLMIQEDIAELARKLNEAHQRIELLWLVDEDGNGFYINPAHVVRLTQG